MVLNRCSSPVLFLSTFDAGKSVEPSLCSVLSVIWILLVQRYCDLFCRYIRSTAVCGETFIAVFADHERIVEATYHYKWTKVLRLQWSVRFCFEKRLRLAFRAWKHADKIISFMSCKRAHEVPAWWCYQCISRKLINLELLGSFRAASAAAGKLGTFCLSICL